MDYGARWYDASIGRWGQVEPLAEKMPSWSTYTYSFNNAVKFIDREGLYPEPILIYDASLGLNGGYRFTRSAAHLLSLVSGLPEYLIANRTIVQKRAIGQYRPFYNVKKTGGGGITLGNGGYFNITYTENYFSDDPKSYDGFGYGQNIYEWLEISSHEVMHIRQNIGHGNFFNYIKEFIFQYTFFGSHDGAPYENVADKGTESFIDFNTYVNKNFGNNSLIDLFKSDKAQSEKVNQIDKWWNAFTKDQSKNKKEQLNSLLNNFSNLNSGDTFNWNGENWVKQ